MTFHELHHAELPLVLPNAWDVASALAFVDAGFPAIGTTSFGLAAAAGHADGGRSTMAGNRRLARALSVLPCYVSVDVEDGYDDDPERVAEYVDELGVGELGVAGVNVEDSSAERLIAPEDHAAKVAAIKQRSPDLYVNARVDTYWLGEDATIEATLARARAYVEAGADGVFVPGTTDPADIAALASSIRAPLNVLASPTLSIDELARLGVRRVSTGSLPYRAAMDAAVEVAARVRDGRALPSATPYPRLQERLNAFQRMGGEA